MHPVTVFSISWDMGDSSYNFNFQIDPLSLILGILIENPNSDHLIPMRKFGVFIPTLLFELNIAKIKDLDRMDSIATYFEDTDDEKKL